MNWKERLAQLQKAETELANKTIRNLRLSGHNFPMVYLPNILPDNQVEYFLIAMEPSMGKWASNQDEGNELVKNGFVNFLLSKDDLILHFSINTWLSPSYHITDVSKIAMTIDNATEIRNLVYPMWKKHLKFEIELLQTPNRKLISIGKTPLPEIESVFPNDVISPIIHFSASARGHRKKMVNQFPEEYERFKDSFKQSELISFSDSFIRNHLKNERVLNLVLGYGLKNVQKELRESDLYLLFNYKKFFENIKQ